MGSESKSWSVKLMGLFTKPKMRIPPEYWVGCAFTLLSVCTINVTAMKKIRTTAPDAFLNFLLNVLNP